MKEWSPTKFTGTQQKGHDHFSACDLIEEPCQQQETIATLLNYTIYG